MYKVLAIGNSFSEDATHFLHQICESSGIENEVVNLYVGGCSLERHWRNVVCVSQSQNNVPNCKDLYTVAFSVKYRIISVSTFGQWWVQ